MRSFDFIIVGGGTAGSLLAARLAKALPRLKVILIEAGGKNEDINYQILGERYLTFKKAEGYNWGYTTVPQSHLGDRVLDYSRGKGLGGSSAINFCVYTRGASADYDRWAELVDDDDWAWSNVERQFNEIETYHEPGPNFQPFAKPLASSHGGTGPVHISFPKEYERGFTDYLKAVQDFGHQRNFDVNSGDPMGVSIAVSTAYNGRRVTASTAYLAEVPPNLTVLTNTAVKRIIVTGKKAVGVEIPGGEIYASKEVILSAGSLDSPKLLLLSGIGPIRELAELDITPIVDLQGVGKGLRDHLFTTLTIIQRPATNDRPAFYNDSQAMSRAKEQWLQDQGGPLTVFQCAQTACFLKNDRVYRSEEFKSLDGSTQDYLKSRTVPVYEILSHTRALTPKVKPEDCYLSLVVAFMNPQSHGEIRLRSADPDEPPLADPKFLSSPFDRRNAIESVRAAVELLDEPRLAKDTLALAAGPDGRTDEEIYDFIQESVMSVWHMCGTLKMGKQEDPTACVDKDFHVVGTEGLRVVDLSIAPVIPNAHTQATAYLIGEMAAQKLIAEYT